MKQKIKIMMLSVAAMFASVSVTAQAQDIGGPILQPQFGKQTVTVPADGELTFYDPKGTDRMSSSSSNNTLSMTVFKPAVEGMSVQVTFDSFDVRNDNTSATSKNYPGEVTVYSGEPDADNTFSWPTTAYGVKSTTLLPEGDVIETMDGTYTDHTLWSTSSDGILSVGMHWVYAKTCEGWTARVRCVRLENMTVTGAGSAYTGVAAMPADKQSVALAGVYVDASGVMNADRLTRIAFRLPVNEGVVDPLSLRLYEGEGSSCKGLSQVPATVEADGDGYVFVLDRQLSGGHNVLTIGGDLLGSAAVGAKVAVAVTSVTTAAHPDGVTPFAVAEAVTVTNPALVMMAAEPQTITVGDVPLAFYDDGGADGQVTGGFSGTVTFLPGADGKKVQVDFTNVKLFEGSIYYQYLNVYNGTEVRPDRLIRRVMSGTTALIHSTSPDGALTVELSNNGTSSTSDGFEATVSLFTPLPMAAGDISVSQVTEGTVCAGDTDQPILRMNIITEGTEPVLTADRFLLTTAGTYESVTHATLYYTGYADDLSTSVKVGETDVTSDAFEIVATTPVQLSEGDNRFWLAYTVSDMAVNGQTIDAALTSVVLGGETVSVDNGNPDGVRTVENIVLSQAGQGTVTKSVNGSITFRTKTKNEYSSDYEAGTDDRINVFRPVHEGMVCQIDFSSFDLYYASTSYGSKSKFRIYNGNGTDGELLWELTSADMKSVGPGRVLRSTAADGALTVYFNPNESASYYTSKGFEATVSEYRQQPMKVESIAVSQSSTEVIPAGTAGHDILAVNVRTTGDLSQCQLEAMSFDLKGLQANIAAAALYYTGRTNTAPTAPSAASAASAVLVATSEVSGEASSLTLTAVSPVTLEEGDNWFFLCVDPSAAAQSDAVIDAALLSVTVDGQTTAVENGDPEGERTVKNIYLMKPGANGEVVIPAGGHIDFYDDGGQNAPSSKNFEGVVTFVPGAEGEVIKLDFTALSLSNKDTLYIYNGSEVAPENLITTYRGASAAPEYHVSDAADGRMTVRFASYSAYSQPDFAITVSSYRKKPMTVIGLKATAVAPATMLRGQTGVPVVRLDVTAEGDYDPLHISSIAIEAARKAGIKNVRVFATDTISTFSDANLYGAETLTGDNVGENGAAVAGNGAVTGDYEISRNGVYKFWLAADVATDAADGAVLTARVASLTTATGDVIEVPANADATAQTTVKSGFHGVLTVGAGADYGTIQGAVDAIAGGIDGPVTIRIARGIYNEQVNVPEIAGASELNTITIESETGFWGDVKIYHDRYTEPAYSDDKMFHEYGVFTIAGADWLTLRGVELTTTDIHYPGVLHIKNMSRHVTVDSCYIHAETTTSYSDDINLIYTYAKSEANANNDYLTVRNCLLEGGYIGVRLAGTSTVKLPKQRGGVVENCVLRNQGSKGIYSYDELGSRIVGNTFENSGVATASTYYGIDINVREAYPVGTVISGNRFALATEKTVNALYVRQNVGTEDAPMIITNNELNINSSSASTYGIQVGSPSSHIDIANNTVRLTGEVAGAALWFNDAMKESVTAVNNILQNEAGGYVYRFYKEGNEKTVTFSNNVLSTSGSVLAFNKTDIATFDDWTALTGESNSHAETVTFLSDDILEPAAEGSLLSALPLAYVTTDICGTPRAAQPTIGAYEYNGSTEAPTVADGYPVARHLTDTTAVIGVRSDMNGRAFIMVRPEGEAAPEVADVVANGMEVTMRTGIEAQAKAENLVTDGRYVPYVVVRSLRGTESGVKAGEAFVASGEIIVEIPNAAVTASGATVEAGSAAVLRATVTDGTAPFTLVWTNGRHEEIGTATAEAIDTEVTVEYVPTECDDYVVTVTDANGKTAADTCRVVVTGEAVTATFENLWLDSESAWAGPDTKGETVTGAYGDTQLAGSFVSGSYSFSNTYSLDWNSWSGFAYSNKTASTFETMADQYNAATGGGHNGSENFAVAFSGGDIRVLNRAEGDSLRGCYVTNSAYAVNSIVNGDSYAQKFTEGSWLKIIFTGHHADGTTTDVEYYLADYRPTKEADRYYLDTWQWVDLRPLGKVTSVSFTIDGSDKNYGYLNTPAYFCMDDFNGHRVIAEAPTQNVTEAIDVSSLFTFDDTEATVTYALADEPVTEEGTEVTLTPDGLLTVSGRSRSLSVVVSATQRGRISYLRIPVDFTNAITDVTSFSTADKEMYDLNGRRIATPQRGVNIVRTKDGKMRKVVHK